MHLHKSHQLKPLEKGEARIAHKAGATRKVKLMLCSTVGSQLPTSEREQLDGTTEFDEQRNSFMSGRNQEDKKHAPKPSARCSSPWRLAKPESLTGQEQRWENSCYATQADHKFQLPSENLDALLASLQLRFQFFKLVPCVNNGKTLSHFFKPSRALVSSASLSCISQASSSDNVLFFLLSLSFFSKSLMCFLMSFASKGLFFFTSILLPDSS